MMCYKILYVILYVVCMYSNSDTVCDNKSNNKIDILNKKCGFIDGRLLLSVTEQEFFVQSDILSHVLTC